MKKILKRLKYSHATHFIFLICFAAIPISGQIADSIAAKSDKKNNVPKKGDVYFSPVPVIGANPAFGFVYGVGASCSWCLGDPASTNLSSALTGLAFTTKKQTIFTVKSTVFLENNNFILMGDWRFLNSSQPTWGLGTGPQSAKLASNNFGFKDGSIEGNSEADMLKFKFFRFHETILKKLNDKGLYAGIGAHVDVFSDFQDQLLNLDSSTQIITPFYAYNFDQGFSQSNSTLVGLSLNGIYDTRDNINNPYKGEYIFISFKVNPTAFGSNKNSSTLWLELRDYYNLTRNNHNILAFWIYGNFTTSGSLPYMNLPAAAWDQYAKSCEPYAQGRFRGTNLMFYGIEFRKHLIATKKNPNFFGAIVYLNYTTASGYKNGIDLYDYIEPGAGIGLRINISKVARTNLGIDYGWGNYGTTGFFLRLNENF